MRNANIILALLLPMIIGFLIAEAIFNGARFTTLLVGLFIILQFLRIIITDGQTKLYTSEEFNGLIERLNELEKEKESSFTDGLE